MMKKKVFFSGLVFTVLFMSCNNSGEGGKSNDTAAVKTDTGSSAIIEKNPSTVSQADSEFMISATNAGMTEVTLGNIAIKNSSNDKVKTFGEMMVKDHTAAGDQLKKIASSKNISLPIHSPRRAKNTLLIWKKAWKGF